MEICSRVFKNHQVFAVNVFSQFWCILEFLPRMLTLNMVKYLHSCKISKKISAVNRCLHRPRQNNVYHPNAGPHSEYVKHGGSNRNTKPCSILCIQGLPNFFTLTGLSSLEMWFPCCSELSHRQFALRGMMEALYLELRADKPDSKVPLTSLIVAMLNTFEGQTYNNSSIHCGHWSCQEAPIKVEYHDDMIILLV